jgi:hypothetical protein
VTAFAASMAVARQYSVTPCGRSDGGMNPVSTMPSATVAPARIEANVDAVLISNL